MNINRLKQTLIKHEAEIPHAYKDSEGYLTIGVGRLIDKRKGGGITHEEAMYLLDNDIHKYMSELYAAQPDVQTLDEVRQEVLINMAFNLGMSNLNEFKKMWAAIKLDDFSTAADEMLDSKWARQVGRRAVELSSVMRTGEFQ